MVDDSYAFDFKIVKDAQGELVLTRTANNNFESINPTLGKILDVGGDNLDALFAKLGTLTTAAEATKALESLEPTRNNAISTVSIDTQNLSLGTDTIAIATGDDSLNKSVWGQIFANTASQGFRKNTAGFDSSTLGFAFGADKQIGDNVTAGTSLSYASTNIDSQKGDSEIESYQLSLYGSYYKDDWYANTIIAVGFNEYDNGRNVTIGGTSDVATAEYSGMQYTTKIEGGRSFATPHGFDVTPIASLQYTLLQLDSYSESGSSANLNVESDDINSLQSGLGAKFGKTFDLANNEINAELHAMWLYDFMANEQEVTSSFAGSPSTSFTSNGVKQARNTLNKGVSAEVIANDQLSFTLGYDFSAKQNYQSHAGMLKASFKF